MIRVRKSEERGHFDHGWLNTYHTFSFADYHDPDFMGFRSLRVINEDRVEAGRGFGTHGHRDMEIISYVLEGELGHADSMGTGSVIRPGEVQRMSAGTGVMHSEKNPADVPVHFLQIWILPERHGIKPGYEQKAFPSPDGMLLVGSCEGRDGSLTIHQDVDLYRATLRDDSSVTFEFRPNRYGWLQVARGSITVNGQELSAGDGAAIEAEERLTIAGTAEALLFDLA
jgi:redox-sensitive bicupin YhaK (pirin superfamily)